MSLGRTEAPLPLRGQESLEEALAGGSLGWAAPAAMPPSCGLAEGAGGCQQPQPSSLRQPKGLFPLCTADLSWPDSLKYFTILQGTSSLIQPPHQLQTNCSAPFLMLWLLLIRFLYSPQFCLSSAFSLFRSQHHVFSQPAFPFLLPPPPCPALETKPPDPLLPGTRSASGTGGDKQEMGKGTVMAMLMAVASLSLQ